MPGTSLYIHIPFCHHRCGYCDFNTYAGIENLIPDYITAINREMQLISSSSDVILPIETIYFGGGTPSLLNALQVETILTSITQYFSFKSNLEITMEANPGTLTYLFLKDINSLGVNRLSLGMQSADPLLLRLLDRQHTTLDTIESFGWARKGGIENINLDLIFGISGQTLRSWDKTLAIACDLGPEHLSLYSLTVERGTPFNSWVMRGLVDEPDPDMAADMYEYAQDMLEKLGFDHYEISNWSKNESSMVLNCRHNLQYWRNLPYLGIGAGAHGYINNYRTINVSHPSSYIERVMQGQILEFPRSPANIRIEAIEKKVEIGETLMMGLRLLDEGISAHVFKQRFEEDLRIYFKTEIDRLINLGLLEWDGLDGDILRLTNKGYLLGNMVFREFI
jgi:oxygen-independent coproporphyrinogen-3 oxidase